MTATPSAALLALALHLAAALPLRAQARIDAFEDAPAWTAQPGEGVSLVLSSAPGRTGRALQLAFDFHGRGGYAVAHRTLDLPLPENYEISFWVRGAAPSNSLEFKLVDSSGANVWWSVRRNFAPGREWTRFRIPRRHITFAWGPAGGGVLRRATAIEIAITAGTGGKGTLLLDGLTIVEREPVRPYSGTPRETAEASGALRIDYGQVRLFGGLVLDWIPGRLPARFDIAVSTDGTAWEPVRSAAVLSARTHLRLPEIEARFLRITAHPRRAGGIGLRDLAVQPIEWSTSRVPMLEAVAAQRPAGDFPRAFAGQQSYWTVVGSADDAQEALLSEDGAVELAAGGPSLEPFLRSEGRLITWHDAQVTHSLADGELPIPTVRWRVRALELDITAAALARGARAPVVVRYRVRNPGDREARVTLYLALRPLQVNPPWQFLAVPGGTAPVGRAAAGRTGMRADGIRLVRLSTPPAQASAAAFAGGDIVVRLRTDSLPADTMASDADSLASAVVAYPLRLAARDSADIFVALPLGGAGGARGAGGAGGARREALAAAAAADPRGYFDRARASWRTELAGFRLEGPPPVDTIARAIRASLGHILINRDGPAIQPGSRSYARSWIRDGALTSTALLRLGHAAEVRDFIEWFAPFQYPSGRVPCCVDRRGADPVPEHDSNGEFIYLVAEYFRLSGDTALARRLWPRIARAAVFLDTLRHQRLTPAFDSGAGRIFRGLLPPSISHEGYSAQPMHSYWDDFFALRGFRDAAWLAATLGRGADAARWDSTAADFRRDLTASIALVRSRRGIAFIPGAADLGDFDATSTTIALDPGDELEALPRDALEATFGRYADEAFRRSDPDSIWNAYTPYEWRNVGAFVRLGWRDRALALLQQLMRDRRPLPWNQWGEVVWRDVRANKFIGDMPHTWVASDFIRSALDLFGYERAVDSSVVILAGVPMQWLATTGGVAVSGLRTSRGELAYRAERRGDSLSVRLPAGLRLGAGGVLIRPPGAARSAVVNGAPIELGQDGEVRIRQLPAEILLRY